MAQLNDVVMSATQMLLADRKGTLDHRCKACKWWSFILYDDDYEDGICTSEYLRTDLILHTDGLKAYGAEEIYTGEDFGCVHWEAK